MVKILGASWKYYYFLQISQNIDGFRRKNLQGFQNSQNFINNNPLDNLFIFIIYQNYTVIGFNLHFSKLTYAEELWVHEMEGWAEESTHRPGDVKEEQESSGQV